MEVAVARALTWVFSHWRARRGLAMSVMGIFGTESGRTPAIRGEKAYAGRRWQPLALTMAISDFLVLM